MVANLQTTAGLLRIITHGSAKNPHHEGPQPQLSNQSARGGSQQPTLQPGSQHTGTVTAQGANGLHTLTFKNGLTLQVQANRPFPVGTQMQIQITHDGHIQILNMNIPAGTQHQQALAQFSGGWSALTQALNALKGQNTKQADAVQQKIPHIGKNFLPAMLLYATAAGEGNILEKLFGDDIDALLKQLGLNLDADAAALQRLTKGPDDPNMWRTLIFPYYESEENDPQYGSFFWRKQKNEEHEDTRFVINISLTNIGPVQIDGLMHDRSLFVKLRLQKEPSEKFSEGLEKVYLETINKLDLQGSIKIEVTTYFDVDPSHDMLRPASQFNVTA